MPAARFAPWILVAALGLALAAMVVRLAWLSDDAYITLRCVENLMRGHGPVWNVGERVQAYKAGEHVHIPVGTVHRIANETGEALEFIEVQMGSYLGEDDIVRLEDRYQRT